MFGGAGDDRLYGGPDDDSLTDWVPTSFDADGPADDDTLYGGLGDDFIGILNGKDVVFAGAGDDLVKLDDDGAADYVDCGPGEDKVIYYGPADPLDELVGCESRHRRVRQRPRLALTCVPALPGASRGLATCGS